MPFNGPDREVAKHPSGGESKTKQADALKCNINSIVEKWMRTGVPPHSDKVARYGDFSNADDYWACTLKVHEAEGEFMKLSARVRQACDNDMGIFLQKVSVPEELDKLKELGLVESQVPASKGDEEAEPTPETPEVPA